MKFNKVIFSMILSGLFSTSAYASKEDNVQKQFDLQKEQLIAIEKKIASLKKQQEQLKLKGNSATKVKNWQINSYGSILYKNEEIFRNIQDVSPEKRTKTDVERVVFEYVYDINEKWQIETEIEYEHGGTGSAIEYDGFEEFGEFETEIEAGGEIIVEKLQARYMVNSNVSVKMGRIFVPVGLGTELHKPNQYFSTERHWSEASVIPQVWHETGVNLISKWHDLTLQTLITTGLNSEYFRTYNWVATGHQKRFEQVNSDDLALTIRLDYGNAKSGTFAGVSFYTGNTTGNRNNSNKVSGNGNLTIIGLHGSYTLNNWLMRGQYLFGQLDNSQEITNANKTTPGLKPGNFSQLGSEADASFVELAYNSQHAFNLSTPLFFYGLYQYANPIKSVEQGNPTSRFDKQEFSVGINYLPNKNLVFKAQVSEQVYAQSNLDNTRSFSLSMGYYFSI